MPKKNSTKTANVEELDALAHHISEALRIMAEADSIPARIYNSFAESWNELCGVALGDSFCHSEAYARLILAELAKKGGAK